MISQADSNSSANFGLAPFDGFVHPASVLTVPLFQEDCVSYRFDTRG